MTLRYLPQVFLMIGWLLFRLTTMGFPQAAGISATAKFFFAYDTSGAVLWKKPLTSRPHLSTYAWNRDFALANFATEVIAYDVLTGRELWRRRFERQVAGVGVRGDTAICMTGEQAEFFDARTGKWAGSFPLKEAERLPFWYGWFSSSFAPGGLEVVQTPHYIVAYNEEANLVWRLPSRGYRLRGSSFDLLFVNSDDTLKVLNLNDGALLWKRGFSSPIVHLVIGGRTEVRLANGKVLTFRSGTGELIKGK